VLSGESFMFLKSLKLILLFSFINYAFWGCTVTYKAQRFEILPNDIIEKVITPSGEEIKFDYKGGYHYMLEDPGILGRKKNGNWVVFRLRDIREIHKTSPKITKWKKYLRNQKITELITLNNTLLRFNPRGGIYDDSDGKIEGLNQKSHEVTYRLKSIKGARIELPEIISKDSLLEIKNQFIAEVLTNNQELIIFDWRGGMFVEASNVIVGFDPKGSPIKLNSDQIDIAYVKQPDPGLTFFAGFFFPLLSILLIAGIYSINP
jgi:hypothetical protein